MLICYIRGRIYVVLLGFSKLYECGWKQPRQVKSSHTEIYLALTISGGEIWQRVVAPLLRDEVVDHVRVEVEGRRRQPLYDNVREVVREEHQVAAGVLQQVRVVLPFIFSHLLAKY